MLVRNVTIATALIGLLAMSQTASAQQGLRPWSSNTATFESVGRVELGLLQRVRFAPSRDIELSLEPLLFAIAPNIRSKIFWGSSPDWFMASQHALLVPLGLEWIEDKTSLVEFQNLTPMVAMKHEWLLTRRLRDRLWFTFDLGLAFALGSDGVQVFPDRRALLADSELAVFGGETVLSAGGEFTGYSGNMAWVVDLNLGWEVEEAFVTARQEAFVVFLTSRAVQPMVGYRAAWRLSPAATSRIIPLVGIRWIVRHAGPNAPK